MGHYDRQKDHMYNKRSSPKLAKNPIMSLITEKVNLPVQLTQNKEDKNSKMIGMLQSTSEAVFYSLDKGLLS